MPMTDLLAISSQRKYSNSFIIQGILCKRCIFIKLSFYSYSQMTDIMTVYRHNADISMQIYYQSTFYGIMKCICKLCSYAKLSLNNNLYDNFLNCCPSSNYFFLLYEILEKNRVRFVIRIYVTF